jgi:hypothetical protein
LNRDHTLQLVLRRDADKRSKCCAVLTVACLVLRLSKPKNAKRLIHENRIPIIVLRSADALEYGLHIIGVIGSDRLGFLASTNGFFAGHRETLTPRDSPGCKLLPPACPPCPCACARLLFHDHHVRVLDYYRDLGPCPSNAARHGLKLSLNLCLLTPIYPASLIDRLIQTDPVSDTPLTRIRLSQRLCSGRGPGISLPKAHPTRAIPALRRGLRSHRSKRKPRRAGASSA